MISLPSEVRFSPSFNTLNQNQPCDYLAVRLHGFVLGINRCQGPAAFILHFVQMLLICLFLRMVIDTFLS